MIDEAEIRRHYELLRPSLNERGRRLFAATQVRAPVTVGLSRCRGRPGLPAVPWSGAEGTRPQPGGGPAGPALGDGRKKLSATDATLAQDLLRLVEPATLGDPMTPLLWVSKSLEKLAVALRGMGHRVSASTVRRGHQEPWGIG